MLFSFSYSMSYISTYVTIHRQSNDISMVIAYLVLSLHRQRYYRSPISKIDGLLI